jgi:hypothetical protein
MVWQQNIVEIVMLARVVEEGRVRRTFQTLAELKIERKGTNMSFGNQ